MSKPNLSKLPHSFADACKWLLLGTFALGLAGLYSIPLFIGRSPLVKDSARLQKLFDTTLVVHVDLSIFVWFLAVIGMIWCLAGAEKRWIRLPYFQGAARTLFIGGTVLMAASPWFGGEHIKSNYLPVIGNGVFLSSIALLAASVATAMVEMLLARQPLRLFCRAFSTEAESDTVLAFGAYVTALILLVAFACFYLTALRIDSSQSGESYYETLFWAGGHVLQFAYVEAMMVAWMLLTGAIGLRLPGPSRLYCLILAVGGVLALLALVPFHGAPVDSLEFREGYTRLMWYGNGLAPALLAALIVAGYLRERRLTERRVRPAASYALLASFLLFLFGGLFGLAITGTNVRVPAHYHGSIVGVTIAFMGLAYVYLPKFGLADPSHWKLARAQPLVLCVGQLIHTGALAYAGGYEVMRKTIGGLDQLPLKVKMAMGLMGLGGAIAVAGGLMFVLVVWRAWRRRTA